MPIRTRLNDDHFYVKLPAKLRGAPRRATVHLHAMRTLLAAQRNPVLRPLIPEINKLRRSLPAWYESHSLPDLLAQLTPSAPDLTDVNPEDLRGLVDAIADLDWRSPFGVCLRRALLRYHFLRRAGIELGIVFGVRFRQTHETAGIAGHAWNTLAGRPYHEREEDYLGFSIMYEWPPEIGESQ